MKTSDHIHHSKYVIIDAVNRVFFRHGNGLDLKIKTSLNSVYITITKFDKGQLLGSENFFFKPSKESHSTFTRQAEEKTIKAIRKLQDENEVVTLSEFGE